MRPIIRIATFLLGLALYFVGARSVVILVFGLDLDLVPPAVVALWVVVFCLGVALLCFGSQGYRRRNLAAFLFLVPITFIFWLAVPLPEPVGFFAAAACTAIALWVTLHVSARKP